MDPDVYGRSLMECSSFLASSAFKDPATQGRGFSARLSGSTAEFLSMWVLMFIGPKPFYVDEKGKLKMQLEPALPIWLFEADGAGGAAIDGGAVTVSIEKGSNSDTAVVVEEPLSISYKLFSSIKVTYFNTQKKDLFGVLPNEYVITFTDGTVENVSGGAIPTHLATRIRKNFDTESIIAYF